MFTLTYSSYHITALGAKHYPRHVASYSKLYSESLAQIVIVDYSIIMHVELHALTV